MQTIPLQHAYFKPFVMPQPPLPPDFSAGSPQEAAPQAQAAVENDETPSSGPSTASIGLSPVVQEFLLRLQEMGLRTYSGTDGNDTLSGWSSSLVDSGDGDDQISVWSESIVDGGAGNDTIKAWSDSKVYGGDGDDRIDVWSDSQADGGDGDDVIKAWSNAIVTGGAGNDTISAWSDSKVDGGDGDDHISVWSGSVVDGGAGNDTIYAISDTDVSGGAGDDIISVGANAVVRFAAGDGKDEVYADLNTKLQLGEGLSPDRTQISVSGSTATISFGDGSDQITLHLSPRGPATLAFADGTTMQIEPEASA